jgi:cold-inducible RNA-binding protein
LLQKVQHTIAEETESMGKRLYVGNLPYRISEDDLANAFGQAGEVADVAIVVDKETGRSKGFGFVEMADDSGAQAAIEELNGAQIGGRTIKVAEANPRPARPNRGGMQRE